MPADKRSFIAESAVLGLLLLAGLVGLGYLLAQSIMDIKLLDRTVEVKGLSEREVAADIAIWPITFNVAENDLGRIYQDIQDKNARIIAFLQKNGFSSDEISISPPAVVDKLAREYDNAGDSRFRYTASSTITVYSSKVDQVRQTMTKVAELGQQGIAIAGDSYSTQFLYTKLN
ncbi:MAG TPA: SIMPL domain-containing protein, partial [Methylophilaceae bacterium]|nr:SIMPL domain-containing protein [Methylophilaceae bacterium]